MLKDMESKLTSSTYLDTPEDVLGLKFDLGIISMNLIAFVPYVWLLISTQKSNFEKVKKYYMFIKHEMLCYPLAINKGWLSAAL